MVQMNYCEADEQVPYQNSLKALDTMMAKGAANVTAISRGASLNHGGCVLPSLTAVQTLFLNLSHSCVTTGIATVTTSERFTIFPNPASANAIIELHSPNGKYNGKMMTICGIDGRIYDEVLVWEGKNELDLSRYQKGVYFVRMLLPDEQKVQKLIVR
jgi:hypothetical protein